MKADAPIDTSCYTDIDGINRNPEAVWCCLMRDLPYVPTILLAASSLTIHK